MKAAIAITLRDWNTTGHRKADNSERCGALHPPGLRKLNRQVLDEGDWHNSGPGHAMSRQIWKMGVPALMVRVVGIEPTLPCENRFLRPARLPVPPHPP
jgi:hypothetical protein